MTSNRPGPFSIAKIAAISAGCFASAMAAKTEVPLFLFSGQSNMVGLGTNSSDLTSDQKKFFPIDNIKVYLDAEGDASRMKKWSTLQPGFGSSLTQFGPELFFGKVLNDSFPGKKFAFIKVARSGTYLGKATEWLPPSSNNGTGGTYYVAMIGSIDAALKTFNSAFDTSLYTPKWVGFIWLQGEFDAMDAALSNQYEANLTNLIKDIRTKASAPDLPVVIPMIDGQSLWTNYTKIWAADIAVTKKLTHIDTVATKGLPTDNIHYKAAGMVTIGERSAARWIKMKTLTTLVFPYRNSPFAVTNPYAYPSARFDLFGRKVGNLSASSKVGSSTLLLDGKKNPQLLYSLPEN